MCSPTRRAVTALEHRGVVVKYHALTYGGQTIPAPRSRAGAGQRCQSRYPTWPRQYRGFMACWQLPMGKFPPCILLIKMSIVELPVDIGVSEGIIFLNEVESCQSTFVPCFGIRTSIQQNLHHFWGLAVPRSQVEGCPSK